MLQSPELEAVEGRAGEGTRDVEGGAVAAMRVRKRPKMSTSTTDALAEEGEGFVGLRNHATRMLDDAKIPRSSPAPNHKAVVQ